MGTEHSLQKSLFECHSRLVIIVVDGESVGKRGDRSHVCHSVCRVRFFEESASLSISEIYSCPSMAYFFFCECEDDAPWFGLVEAWNSD
jgi:hypothetical protein